VKNFTNIIVPSSDQ